MNGLPAVLVPPLNPAQRAVWKHFQQGGSAIAVVAVLLAIGVIFALCWWLSRFVTAKAPKAESPDPWKVFQAVSSAMKLPKTQQVLLRSMARDLRMVNPSVLLLSPVLFEQAISQWQAQPPHSVSSPNGDNAESELIAQVRTALFD